MRPHDLLDSHRPFRTWIGLLACAAAIALRAAPSDAQSLLRVPTPNAPVYAFATIGNTAYVGGAFDRIGFFTGGGAALDAATGALRSGNPGFRVGGASVFYPGGIVTAAVADGAGGWYIGGDFASLGGVSRPYLARVDANGNLLAWTPPAPNGPVWSMLLSGTTLYVGGDFTTLGGTARSNLAAVNATTGALLGWNPGADGRVDALAISGGTLYVGGSFYNLGGSARAAIGAVDAVTGALTGWNPNLGPFPPDVQAITIGPGVAYVGGSFGTAQGVARTNAVAVDLATAMPTAWAPNPNNTVHSIVLGAGVIYVGGEFTSIGGRARVGLAQVNDSNGNASISWNAGCDGYAFQLLLNGGTLTVAGAFDALGGQARTNLGAIDATSALATAWAPSVDNRVWCVVPSGTGVFIGGQLQRLASVRRRGLAAIDLTTRSVTSWDPDVNGTVRALATDGVTLYVGGQFSQAGGVARNSLAAYALPSATPTAFDAAVNQGSAMIPMIYSLVLESGVLRVAGLIDHLGGQARDYAGAVDVTTALATPWAPQPNSAVRAIQPSAAGVYLAGAFSTVQGSARALLAQVDRTTGAPTTWTPPVFAGGYAFGGHLVPANLFSLEELGGVLYVGGSFQSVSSQLRANLAALDASGTLLPWNPNGYYTANANQGTLALDAAGTNLLAGSNAPVVNGFRLIDASSGALAGWPPFFLDVEAVGHAGGYLLLGGGFLDAGSMPSPNLAVFIDPAALAVDDQPCSGAVVSLSRPAPNPAGLATSLHWTLTHRAVVSLALLDLAGRRVRTIVDHAELAAGPHTQALDVTGLAPGLYLLAAESEGVRATRKLLIAR